MPQRQAVFHVKSQQMCNINRGIIGSFPILTMDQYNARFTKIHDQNGISIKNIDKKTLVTRMIMARLNSNPDYWLSIVCDIVSNLLESKRKLAVTTSINKLEMSGT